MSHTLKTALSGSGIPTSVTPEFIGQIYTDTTNSKIYSAKSLTIGDWVSFSYLSTNYITTSYFSDWTWQNQGSATLADNHLGVSFYVPGSIAANVRHLVKAVPSSSYQLTAQLVWNGNQTYQRLYMGWKAALGASAKLELLALTTNSSVFQIRRSDWNHETSYNTITTLKTYVRHQSVGLRIKETGGNIYLYYGYNGNSWYPFASYAKGAGFLASNEYNYLVIGADNITSSSEHTMDILNCKLEAV